MKTLNLEPAKSVLRTFLAEIESTEPMRGGISASNLPVLTFDRPNSREIEFPQAPDTEDAYMWIYAEPRHFRSLMHRPKSNQVPEYYQQKARPLYQEWKDSEKDIFFRGRIIPLPEDATLGNYLLRLFLLVTEKNEKRAVWTKSLRSFCKFLRKKMPLELQGNLDAIFPREMEIRTDYQFRRTEKGVERVDCNCILRTVKDPVYSIDIWAFAEILQNLIKIALEGRPDSQRSALEALGFAWLCNAVGSYCLMTREKIVYKSPLVLKCVDPSKPKVYFQPECHISIQTLNGYIDTPISRTLHDFLFALPRDTANHRIFTTPLSSLLRTLYRAIELSDRCKDLGHITFLTFMSQPHLAEGHRFSPLRNQSKPKAK